MCLKPLTSRSSGRGFAAPLSFAVRSQIMKQDASARLIYEAIQQLGWDADPTHLADRIRGLESGLPAEDEFACLLAWFGKCQLVHSLDQSQHPAESRNTIQVLDLLAVLEPCDHGDAQTVLIEVKTSKKPRLSWTPAYMTKVKKYAAFVGLPLLVAWKFQSLWTLVSVDAFTQPERNLHLSLQDALRHNLMGILAGDFAYAMRPKVGLHLYITKERLISEHQQSDSEREEHWQYRIRDAYFLNEAGQRKSQLRTGLWPLFISACPEAKDEVTESSIHQQFCIPDEPDIHFAHAALPILIAFSAKEEAPLLWRKQLDGGEFPVKFEVFRKAATEGIEDGFVQVVLDQKPVEIPEFIGKNDRTKP